MRTWSTFKILTVRYCQEVFQGAISEFPAMYKNIRPDGSMLFLLEEVAVLILVGNRIALPRSEHSRCPAAIHLLRPGGLQMINAILYRLGRNNDSALECAPVSSILG